MIECRANGGANQQRDRKLDYIIRFRVIWFHEWYRNHLSRYAKMKRNSIDCCNSNHCEKCCIARDTVLDNKASDVDWRKREIARGIVNHRASAT